MMISTKGRYALRLMIDLAENSADSYVPLRDIASRQGVSEKYLESIISLLSRGGLLEGMRGKGGGYRLVKHPSLYTAGEILRLAEGSLSPVPCLDSGHVGCRRESECKTLPMWRRLDTLISEFFEGITLEELVKGETVPVTYTI